MSVELDVQAEGSTEMDLGRDAEQPSYSWSQEKVWPPKHVKDGMRVNLGKSEEHQYLKDRQ